MARQPIIHLLIALLLLAQFDDVWVSAPVLSSTPATGDGDEYLPSERRQSEPSVPDHLPLPAGLSNRAGSSLSIRPSPATASRPTQAFGRSLLYVFMSLQC
jgi:hypothetical protein